MRVSINESISIKILLYTYVLYVKAYNKKIMGSANKQFIPKEIKAIYTFPDFTRTCRTHLVPYKAVDCRVRLRVYGFPRDLPFF